MESDHLSHTNGHIGIRRKIQINLKHIGQHADPECRSVSSFQRSNRNGFISFKKKDRNRNASIDSSSTGLAEDLVAGEEGTSKKKENGQEKKQGSKTEKKDGKKKKEPEKPDNSLDVGELLKKKQDRNL